MVSKIDSDHFILPHLGNSERDIVDLHPAHSLALLHAALSDDVKSWPFGVDDLLLRISKADPEIRADERFVELAKKWDKR